MPGIRCRALQILTAKEVTLDQDSSRDVDVVVVSCGSAEQGSKKLIRVDTGHVHSIMAASLPSVCVCVCICWCVCVLVAVVYAL